MKPEELKIIAEGMGYESEIRGATHAVYIRIPQQVMGAPALPYNPLTNDTQCMEIMEKHELLIEPPDSDGNWMASNGKYFAYGESLKEAVCRYALERFNGERNEKA